MKLTELIEKFSKIKSEKMDDATKEKFNSAIKEIEELEKQFEHDFEVLMRDTRDDLGNIIKNLPLEKDKDYLIKEYVRGLLDR